MSRAIYGNLDLVDNQLLNIRLQVLGSHPPNPSLYSAKIYYNSTDKTIYYHDGSGWVAVGTAGAGGPPSGGAGGDLSGSYPNPQIAAGVIVDADINSAAAIAQSKISGLTTSLSGKVDNTVVLTAGAGITGGGDLTAARTFDVGAGTGITVNPNDVAINRTVTDTWYTAAGASAPPSGTAGGDLSGTYPNPQIAAGVILDADINGGANIAQSKIATLTTDLAARVLKAGDTMGGFLTLNADPSNPLHAATKQYVDITAQGYTFKNAVRVVSTTNQAALSGLLTIDGVTLVAGNRVLLAAQTTTTQNGIYTAAAGAWSRATDMDASGELADGTLVPVAEGTVNQDTQWLCTSVGTAPWVPGTNTSVWVRQSSLADLNAGAGLTKTGTTVDFVAGDATLTVAADNVVVASAPKWTTGRTITLTGDNTGTSAAWDGSGNISFATVGVQAAKWTTGRTITLTGDVTGVSAAWDGSSNISFVTDNAAGAIVDADINAAANIAQSKISGLGTSLSGKVDTSRSVIAGAGLTGGGTLASDVTLNVVGDANLSVAADLVSVLSAPKWTTARTITLGGDLTGNVSIDGSANATLTATLAAGAGGKRYAQALTASTSQVVTHNLNTQDVIVNVYNGSSPYDEIWTEVQHTSVNTITIIANPALPAGYRVVVLG